jgi:hypothetical protein
VVKHWDRGTFPNRLQRLRYHHAKHGNRGQSLKNYARQGFKLSKRVGKTGRIVRVRGAGGGIVAKKWEDLYDMVNIELYKEVLSRLQSHRPPVQPDDEFEFDCWPSMVECDSFLAGFLSTVVHGGKSSTRDEIRSVQNKLVNLRPTSIELTSWRQALLSDIKDVLDGY